MKKSLIICQAIFTLILILQPMQILADPTAGVPVQQNILVVTSGAAIPAALNELRNTKYQVCDATLPWPDDGFHIGPKNNVTTASSIPADLSAYDQVWDFRFDQVACGCAPAPCTPPPTCSAGISPAEMGYLRTFMSRAGTAGTVFLMGDNSGFPGRNTSITTFVNSVMASGTFGGVQGTINNAGGCCAVLQSGVAAGMENFATDYYDLTFGGSNPNGTIWTEFAGVVPLGQLGTGRAAYISNSGVAGEQGAVGIGFMYNDLAAAYNRSKLFIWNDWQTFRDQQCGSAYGNSRLVRNIMDFLSIKTPTPTETPTRTATNTPTTTFTRTNTPSPTLTYTPTRTNSPTNTFTGTPTNSPTNTPTNTPTRTNTPTNTFTNTPSNTPTNTFTNTPTRTNTSTLTSTPTFTFTNTPTRTNTPTNSATATSTSTPTWTFTNTPTRTPTNTLTNTPTYTPTNTVTNTNSPTNTNTNTPTNTFTLTYTRTFTPTLTWTGTAPPTWTYTNTPTSTSTFTETYTRTFTNTPTNTNTATYTFTPSYTRTPTNTFTMTFTPTETATGVPPATWTPSFTPTNTNTNTFTFTPTNSYTETYTRTFTNTPTWTYTPTLTWTGTPPPTATNTPTYTYTPTFTYTFTNTRTNTPTFTSTNTNTFTNTATWTFTYTFTDTSTPTYTFTATNTFTRTNTPTPTPNPPQLSIEATPSVFSIQKGEQVEIKVQVTNNGAGTASNVQVWNTLPGDLIASADARNAVWATGPGAGQVSINVGTLLPGETRVYSLIVESTVAETLTGMITIDPFNASGMAANDPPGTTRNTDSIKKIDFYIGELKIFPNPFNPEKAVGGVMKFINLPYGSQVQIFSVSGEQVINFSALTKAIAFWDGKNYAGTAVSPGIYYYVVKTAPGGAGPARDLIQKGKLFVVRN